MPSKSRMRCRIPSESSTAALRAAGFGLKHVIRARGRARLGLSCNLFGTGMGFSAALLQRVPWPQSMTEDTELFVRLTRAGYHVAYAEAHRSPRRCQPHPARLPSSSCGGSRATPTSPAASCGAAVADASHRRPPVPRRGGRVGAPLPVAHGGRRAGPAGRRNVGAEPAAGRGSVGDDRRAGRVRARGPGGSRWDGPHPGHDRPRSGLCRRPAARSGARSGGPGRADVGANDTTRGGDRVCSPLRSAP